MMSYDENCVSQIYGRHMTIVSIKVILLECPSNPTQELADIQVISTRAKQIKPDIIIVVDNSILTPIFQRPLELGADVVVYSLTKYPAGFSDIVMGSIVCNTEELYNSYMNSQRCN